MVLKRKPLARPTPPRYASAKNAQLRSLLSRADRVDRATLDLEPEIQLLRAMVLHYVETYEQTNTMLETWYRAKVDEYRNRGSKGSPPVPPRPMELHDARELIEAISRVVERTHKIQTTGAISLDTFQKLVESMGLIVARHVRDSQVLKAVEQDWSLLVVDNRTHRPTAPDA